MAMLMPLSLRDSPSTEMGRMMLKSTWPSISLLSCISLVGCITSQAHQTESRQQPQQTTETSSRNERGSSAENGSATGVGGDSQPDDARKNELGLQLLKNLARDQKAIWTSPAHLRLGDATWLVPFAGLTAGFLVTDHDASSHLGGSPATLRHYTSFSNYGLAGMAGAGAGLYLLGKATHD
jgi:hypothetical protein